MIITYKIKTMYYVYDLIDNAGNTIYVGQSKNLKNRMYMHKGIRKSPFYGRSDISIVPINSYNTRSDARKAEGERKLLLGFDWTENIAAKCGGKLRRALTIPITKEIKLIYDNGNITQTNLAKMYNVSQSTISLIVNNQTYLEL